MDRIARERWVTRDARLQNLIISSIDKSLTPQVRSATVAYDMYITLKELNNSSDHANAQLAWIAFIDLSADSCRSVREYIGKFRETINDLATQGISLQWHKPSQLTDAGAVTNSLEELMVIHMLPWLWAIHGRLCRCTVGLLCSNDPALSGGRKLYCRRKMRCTGSYERRSVTRGSIKIMDGIATSRAQSICLQVL